MTNPFQFPNGQLAYSAEDLLALCQEFPDDGINYLVREDLEKWLAYIGKQDIAECAANARQTPLEDRQKLEEFLNKCHALSSPDRDLMETKLESTPVVETKPEPAPSAVETPIVETKPESTPSAVKTPVVETKPEPIAVETPVVETKPEPKSTPVAVKASVVETKTKPTPVKKSTETKPSFFKVVAGLIVNVLYRDKSNK